MLKTDFINGLTLGSNIEKAEYTSVVQDESNPVKANQWNLTGRDNVNQFRSGSSPVITSKLTYPEYVGSETDAYAIKLAKLSSGGRMTVYSMTDGIEYTRKPYYLAFMVRVDDISSLFVENEASFISFDGNYTGNHLRGRVILKPGSQSGKVAFALGSSVVSDNQTVDYNIGETVLMVLKYNFFNSSKRISLFINPPITEEEPLEPDIFLDFPGTDALAQIRGISLRQQSIYAVTIGGLRFSDRWTKAIGCVSTGNEDGYTELIRYDNSNKLVYSPDSDGYYLPDFSYAGYKGGGVELPNVSVVKSISPVSGDNTAHIQAAIDEVGNKPLNANGHRGTLLLNAGKYNISGRLYVKYSGVVIRGVGNGTSETNSTILYATGNSPAKRDLILLGYPSNNTWNTVIGGTQKNITDDFVPAGAMSFTVENSAPYAIGDQIAIYHPCSAQWLNAIDYGGVPVPQEGEADNRWVVDQLPIIFNRYITKIEGNKITVDAPLFYTLNKALSQSYIYKFDRTSKPILTEIGIENLRVETENVGGTDENHAWTTIRFRAAENCWAKDIVTRGFGFAGISVDGTTRSTIENCTATDPVSVVTGERRYNFNAGAYSQLVLFRNCYAENGRHSFALNGMSTSSGVVFLNCTSSSSYAASEAHMKWSQGLLYDNYKEKNVNVNNSFVVGLYNRINMGTGHGWSAVQSVLWNCNVTDMGVIGLQKPPTSQNYAIGCVAGEITGKPINTSEFVSDFPLGYVESRNKPITEIPSLYLAQLNKRLGLPPMNIQDEAAFDKPYSINQNDNGVLISFKEGYMSTHLVQVFDINGKIIHMLNSGNRDVNFGLSIKGVYIINIHTLSGVYTDKILH